MIPNRSHYFYLLGCEKIYSVDISFLTSKERIHTTIKKFIEANDKALLNKYFAINENRSEQLISLNNSIDSISLEELILKLNLEYLIQDARHLELPDNSVDLVNSNNTFEHIYPEILFSILKDFKRVVNKEHGVMSHFIDMSDHFAHFDKSINIYNFLQFSDKQWYWIDNSIQPQNRLRIDDYKLIYKNLDIPISAESFREGRMNELKAIKLNDKFLEKPLETIAISHCHFISKMGK